MLEMRIIVILIKIGPENYKCPPKSVSKVTLEGGGELHKKVI